jgi:hypothetical protein
MDGIARGPNASGWIGFIILLDVFVLITLSIYLKD